MATDCSYACTSTGYKVGADKSPEELAKLDANDESLARWKASLGIVQGASGGDTSGPKVIIRLYIIAFGNG
jgi:Rho GDP-dissociation inhibitor